MATLLKTAYAVYPSVKLKGYKTDSRTKKKKWGILKELLFGDHIKPYIKDGDYESVTISERGKDVVYIKVRARGKDGYLRENDFQAKRVLEVNFIDVGQGDGCHIVTPDDKHFLIDAGPGDNMFRFLKWRFNIKNAQQTAPPFTVVVSHSDADHYKGFGKVFDASATGQFTIKKIYHNGMVELSGTGPDSLGRIVEKNGVAYVVELCDTDAAFRKRSGTAEGAGVFVTTMNKTDAPKQSLRLGSAPLYRNGDMVMEVLGPVAKKVNGKDAFPVFDSNKGKTKNGHSVVIKLTIGHLRMILGGDLNTEAEYHLLQHYTGVNVGEIRRELRRENISEGQRKMLLKQLEGAIDEARNSLEVDIAKSCHHGSADFTSEFLRALNPIATIISSGDNEPHTHPRPDTLGTIGKHSRGERSLIFCTELARSSKEFVDLSKVKSGSTKERVITVYGMINVRTDGEKVIIAQKLERPAAGRGWDIHKLEWNASKGQFEYLQYKKYEE